MAPAPTPPLLVTPRRRRVTARLARARTPADRLAVACDYARASNRERHRDQAHADRVLDDAAQRLMAAVDVLEATR